MFRRREINLPIPSVFEINLAQTIQKFAFLALVELFHCVNDFVHAHIFNIAELAALSAMLCRCRFLFFYKIDDLAEIINDRFQFSDGFAGEFRIAQQSEVSVESKDIIVAQAKFNRLGMSLLGQAFFSAQLMQRFHPRSVESVALVTKDDDVLRPLFEQYPGMRVVVYPHER